MIIRTIHLTERQWSSSNLTHGHDGSVWRQKKRLDLWWHYITPPAPNRLSRRKVYTPTHYIPIAIFNLLCMKIMMLFWYILLVKTPQADFPRRQRLRWVDRPLHSDSNIHSFLHEYNNVILAYVACWGNWLTFLAVRNCVELHTCPAVTPTFDHVCLGFRVMGN